MTVNGVSFATDSKGTARATAPRGQVRVSVKKEGFLPATTSLTIDDLAHEWQVKIELQPERHESEEITVFATRTDTRLQDVPTRVEVLAQEEIEEKMMMTPGDITMMLNEMGGMRVQTTSPGSVRQVFAYKACAAGTHAFSRMAYRSSDSRAEGSGFFKSRRWTWARSK